MENMHHGHRLRLKTQFLEQGMEKMPPHNVLELILFYSVPQKDTNQLAHALIEHFGSLAGVLDAPIEELQKIKGITHHSATLIKLFPAVSSRYYEEKIDVSGAENVMEVVGRRLVARYLGKTNEIAYLICLDNRLKELFFGPISEGSTDSVGILTRKIVEIALRYNASSIILAHNHPNGFALASRRDIETTLQLCDALRPISIKLLDHIIVSGDDFMSMEQSGMLKSDYIRSLRSNLTNTIV